MLADLIERETLESLDLRNRITVEVLTASFRTVRGRTVVACLLDELAFWRDETSANPDTEIVAALRPASATIPGALMLKASSPYARRGVLYDDHRKHFGRDDSDVLVWQAATRTMNPTVPESFIASETEKDPANAAAEYEAQFRSDIESFISREVIDAVVVPGRHELPPYGLLHTYSAFVDPSGGSADSMTLAIVHREGDIAILDVLRERRPPFNPSEVVSEFCAVLQQYGVQSVRGDRYGAEWVASQFRERGISYNTAELAKSEIYNELLP